MRPGGKWIAAIAALLPVFVRFVCYRVPGMRNILAGAGHGIAPCQRGSLQDEETDQNKLFHVIHLSYQQRARAPSLYKHLKP